MGLPLKYVSREQKKLRREDINNKNVYKYLPLNSLINVQTNKRKQTKKKLVLQNFHFYFFPGAKSIDIPRDTYTWRSFISWYSKNQIVI